MIVSMSYGLTEGQIGNVTSLNSTYLTGNVPLTTVPMTISTGDSSRPLFPATSPNVIGVGGAACSSLRRVVATASRPPGAVSLKPEQAAAGEATLPRPPTRPRTA